LILPDPTAIGVGLSHASRAPRATAGRGGRLSNTWLTYPREGDNLGKAPQQLNKKLWHPETEANPP